MEKTENIPEIEEIIKNNVVIFRIKGKLNAPLSVAIEKTTVEHLNSKHNNFLLNLTDTSYINSAGLRMLLSVKKQIKAQDGKFAVCGLNTELLEIMKICGFDHVLEIAKNEEEALRQFDGH